MAKLTAAARKKIPASKFAGPDRSFPVEDKRHAIAAEAYKRYADPATKKRIDAKAAKFGVGPRAHKGDVKSGGIMMRKH